MLLCLIVKCRMLMISNRKLKSIWMISRTRSRKLMKVIQIKKSDNIPRTSLKVIIVGLLCLQ